MKTMIIVYGVIIFNKTYISIRGEKMNYNQERAIKGIVVDAGHGGYSYVLVQ